jgi:hypothetical protein
MEDHIFRTSASSLSGPCVADSDPLTHDRNYGSKKPRSSDS